MYRDFSTRLSSPTHKSNNTFATLLSITPFLMMFILGSFVPNASTESLKPPAAVSVTDPNSSKNEVAFAIFIDWEMSIGKNDVGPGKIDV